MPDTVAEVTRYRPAVLAGRMETLLDLYPQLETLPTHGIVVFTAEGERCLAEADRDVLWDTYRVPLFEEVITREGRLVAWECQAHDGLHLSPGAQASRHDTVETGICACGMSGSRAIDPRVAPAFNGQPDESLLMLPAQIGSATRSIVT